MLRCSQRIDGAWMLVRVNHCNERTSTVATSCELDKTTMLWVPFGASTLLVGQLEGHLACEQLLQLSQSFCFVGPQLSRSNTRQEGCLRWECAGVCCAGAVNKLFALRVRWCLLCRCGEQAVCAESALVSAVQVRWTSCSRWECAGVCCAGAVNKLFALRVRWCLLCRCGQQAPCRRAEPCCCQDPGSLEGLSHSARCRQQTWPRAQSSCCYRHSENGNHTDTDTRHDLQVFRLFDRTEAPQI